MGIKGDLRSIPLANVLQDLAMNEQTGTLRIRAKDRRAAFWFEKGALRLVGLGRGEGPSPMNGLIALGKIGSDEVAAFSARRPTEGSFIRGGVKKGRFSRADLKAALEHQMAEHLCDAFLWKEATFEFEEGEPDDSTFDTDQLDLEPRLAVDAVILEAVRRVDEWGETRKAIVSTGEILVADPAHAPADADGSVLRVLSLLDGERSLKDVMELTRLGQFAVQRAAALLIKAGAARPLTAADAFERARARAAKKDWEAALRMARYGLDHERSNTGLLELALRCAEGIEDADAAASYARQLAAAQVEAGQLEQAIASYQKVLVHAPRDLTAHERLFGLLLQLDLKLDALAAGEALAAAFKKAGLPDKALEVYKRLVEKLGDQPDLLESLAEVQRHLGDRREAIGLYRKLLARALEAKNDDLALDYCRTILKIDPRHEEAQKLRRQLEAGELEKARRRRRRLKALLAGAVAAALVILLAGYEWRARGAYAQVRLAILDAREDRRYAEALSLYDAVLDGYPWSLEARQIRPERDSVEERFAEEELERAARRAEAGLLTEAEEILDAVLPRLRAEERRRRLRQSREDYRRRRVEKVEEWRLRLREMTPGQIERVHDPLAVRPLEELAAGEDAARRMAAVRALGGFDAKVEAAVAALTRASESRDAAVAAEAARLLAEKGKPPLQAAIVLSKPSLATGAPLLAEWRITNASRAGLEFTFEEPPGRHLTVKASSPVAPLAGVSEPPRTVRLGPGEFVGGTFELTASTGAPGTYQIEWKAALRWRDSRVEVAAPAVPFERTR